MTEGGRLGLVQVAEISEWTLPFLVRDRLRFPVAGVYEGGVSFLAFSPSAEGLADPVMARELADWLRKPRTPLLKSRDLDQALNWAHPRAQFVKTLPRDAHLLDFGAGDGGLVVFRSWPAPKREDLTFYGYSLEPIARARDFQAVEIARFEDRAPQFGGRRFDAVFCSHVIEHLNDPEAFLDWAQQALATRGRLYLEWPSTATLTLPRREDLLAHGVDVMVSNFFDDATHQALPDRAAVVSGLEGRGFSIEQAGIIRLP